MDKKSLLRSVMCLEWKISGFGNFFLILVDGEEIEKEFVDGGKNLHFNSRTLQCTGGKTRTTSTFSALNCFVFSIEC